MLAVRTVGLLSGPLLILVLLSACAEGEKNTAPAKPAGTSEYSNDQAVDIQQYHGKPATRATEALQAEAAKNLPLGDFVDGSNFTDHTSETLIAGLPANIATYDRNSYAFVNQARPSTIHPSTFANMKDMLRQSGLFQMADGVYQIRGDLARVTVVRGNKGWIIVDAGLTKTFTQAAWQFALEHLPGGKAVPVSTIIYSHSHVDHFGGVKGFVSQADVNSGKVEVIAPHGFMKEALAENIIAGSAMFRRSQYHFGANLDTEADGTGRFYIGLTPGEYTLIAPTLELPAGTGKVTPLVVDGMDIQFMDIGGAEAPAATIMYFPKYKMLFNSELMFRGMHNIYTLRGAQVRDALAWSKLIGLVMQQWGSDIDLMTGPHGPSFEGREKILEYMALQRDNYGFVHNQTLRLINSGMKIQDVGQAIDDMVPESLSKVWHTHGYHGTYSHNARGVANRYLGFYNGNPAYLNPLPLKSESRKFVEYMGGSDSILEKSRADFEQGEYRFVATALNKLVVAQPDNWPARHLLADAMEQLGYQAEGPQWRNAYLTASKELRTGVIGVPEGDSDQSDLLLAATVDDLLDAMAVKINGPEAADENVAINIHITDTNKRYAVVLSNSNLSYSVVGEFGDADTTLSISRQDLMRLMGGQLKMTELISLGAASIDGSPFSLVTLLGLIEKDNRFYPLVPMPEA